jgi:uncharacterized Zn finger protein
VSRESAAAKARRLLVEGRVRIVSVDRGVRAEVRGDSARLYDVSWFDDGGWRCDCRAYGRACSHVQAVQLVVVVAPRESS